MSVIDQFRKRERLPVMANLPMPRDAQADFAEEAARVHTRFLEQAQRIDALTNEVEQWRSRATMAEGDLERARRREDELLDRIDRKSEEAVQSLDQYKQIIAVLKAQFATASRILIEGFDSIGKLEAGQIKINEAQFAAAIEPHPSDPHDAVAPERQDQEE